MNDQVRVSPEPGDRVRLLFSTMYVERLQPGIRGTVAAANNLGTIHVLWDNGMEQELRASEDPYRLLIKMFSTKAHGGGKLVMQLLDDKSKAPGMPKPGDRVEFRFTNIRSSELWAGNKGVIDTVDKQGVIHVSWDSGAKIALVPGWDVYVVLPEDEGGDGDVENG